MTDPEHRAPLETGEGYLNMEDDSSYKGRISVYPNWVTVQNDSSKYTVKRENVDFINWKEVFER